MTRPLTWLIASAILTLAIAAVVDALSNSDSGPEAAITNRFLAPTPAPAVSSERAPICTTPQLELTIEILGGSAAVALRHVSGPLCRIRRLPVKLAVRDPDGHQIPLAVGESFGVSAFRGDFSTGFEQLRNVMFLPNCTPETVSALTYVLRAHAGPYHARKKLPGKEIGCFAGG